MKETKRRIEFFSLYDHTNIEKHLEKMAAKGWLIENIGSTFWKYKKIEPQKLRFSVVYYPKKVNEGVIVSADRQNFIDICSSGGWAYVINYGQMHIFCTNDENTPPIETDPEIQIECIHKFAKSDIITNNLVTIGCCIFLIAFWGYQMLKEPVVIITDEFCKVWYTPFFIAFSIYNIFSYLLWYRKAKAYAENGEFTETKRIFNINILFWLPVYWFSITLEIFTLIRFRYVLFILGLIAAAILLYKLFKALRKAIGNSSKLKDETKQLLKGFLAVYLVVGYIAAGIFAFTLIPKPYEKVEIRSEITGETYTVYHDEGAPLDISEFIDIEDKTVSREKSVDEAILLKQTEWTVYSVNEEEYNKIRYTITDVRFTLILEKCKNELIYDQYIFGYKKLDINSEYEIYQAAIDSERWSNTFVFSNGNRIAEIYFNWEPSEEELLCAAEKLMNADV
ncbi:MAG: DUF2812 domain-containing protein [Clostridia bacterium]|nr:DUF2812 domain-containing protein [Clostridia bacterium]